MGKWRLFHNISAAHGRYADQSTLGPKYSGFNDRYAFMLRRLAPGRAVTRL